MNASKYSESQIICGLQQAWPEIVGGEGEFDSDTSIYEYMKSDGSWDELDFADIFRELEWFFGFSCCDEEWKQLFGFQAAEQSLATWEREFAPTLTFGVLAHFITERAPAISFGPTTVFGRECHPAGVFYGLQQLGIKSSKGEQRIVPSDRIIDILRGNQLHSFWTHVCWISERAVPKLPAFWRHVVGNAFCIGFLSIFMALWATLTFGGLAKVVIAIFFAITVFTIASAYKHYTNPLPREIVTFRDLALAIAKRRLN